MCRERANFSIPNKLCREDFGSPNSGSASSAIQTLLSFQSCNQLAEPEFGDPLRQF
jgi:hypothetical protein